MGAAWAGAIVAQYAARVAPGSGESASPSPSVAASETPEIPVNLYPTIERFMTDADTAAGLESLDVPTIADGTFTVVPGSAPAPGKGPVRLVRFEVEDGLPINAGAAAAYIMGILNNPQGWGAHDRVTFGRTDGVADIRIILASPKRADAMCARPHDAASLPVSPPDVPPGPIGIGATATANATPSPTASPTTSPSASASPSPTRPPSCADRGMVVISAYQWATGLEDFGDDVYSAHAYLVNHFVGHILGEPDAVCKAPAKGKAAVVASVMVNQELDISPCLPNPWPFPEEKDGG